MWSLVSNASIVVQLVMLTLVAASVTSWIMIFQRSNLLRAGRRALESFEERFWSGIDLSKLYRQAGSNPDPDSGVEQIFRAGFKEFSRLRQQPGVDPELGAKITAAAQKSLPAALPRPVSMRDSAIFAWQQFLTLNMKAAQPNGQTIPRGTPDVQISSVTDGAAGRQAQNRGPTD